MIWVVSFVPVCHQIHAVVPIIIRVSSEQALNRCIYHRVNLFDYAEDLVFNWCFLYRTKEKSYFTIAFDAVVIDHSSI